MSIEKPTAEIFKGGDRSEVASDREIPTVKEQILTSIQGYVDARSKMVAEISTLPLDGIVKMVKELDTACRDETLNKEQQTEATLLSTVLQEQAIRIHGQDSYQRAFFQSE